MNPNKRHIAFIDILGMRRALSSGNVNIAERKILKLSEIIKHTIQDFPGIRAHAATDFGYLWSDIEEEG